MTGWGTDCCFDDDLTVWPAEANTRTFETKHVGDIIKREWGVTRKKGKLTRRVRVLARVPRQDKMTMTWQKLFFGTAEIKSVSTLPLCVLNTFT
jgi:hypothetical protein|tara:strand:- start:18427 stop:18708 length:282 start_codon:yes stop_codon:yes gene_type:complete